MCFILEVVCSIELFFGYQFQLAGYQSSAGIFCSFFSAFSFASSPLHVEFLALEATTIVSC